MDAGLAGHHAVALIRSIVGADLDGFSDDELERATQRLGGTPRGLEHLANQLTGDPKKVTDLLDSDRTLDQLMTELVSEAFLALDGDSRRVVELLAVAEVPIPDGDIPQILTGMVDPDVARASLRELIRSRDIGYDAPARSVRLHPLDADWVWHQRLRRGRTGGARPPSGHLVRRSAHPAGLVAGVVRRDAAAPRVPPPLAGRRPRRCDGRARPDRRVPRAQG